MTSLNKPIVLRLVRYLRVLRKLKSLGIVNVFSNNLGDAVGVTPAVVRKDFSQINIPGNKRGGYNIDVLMEQLGLILGKRSSQKVIIVGCGRIGSALIEYKEFEKEGLEVVAGFDVDPEIINPDSKVPIYHTDTLPQFIKENEIEIGIIAVPEMSANEVFEKMLGAGVRGFLNFTPVELKCQGKCDKDNCALHCTVHTVNIGLELENLFYLINMHGPHRLDGSSETIISSDH